MSCEHLAQRLGFECRALTESLISVATPFSFADGEAIGFYLDDQQPDIVVSDNGDTIFHLRGVGFDLSDRRRWKPIKQIAESHGFELLDSGEIRATANRESCSNLIARYISAMLDIANLEREQLGLPEEIDRFVQEVEFYLHAWKPQASIIHSPSLKGMSGRMHSFNFEFDGMLVDAARPHSGKTGALLRKFADISLTGAVTPILVIMDDRDDADRARVETDILTSMVSVMALSQLAKNAGADSGVLN